MNEPASRPAGELVRWLHDVDRVLNGSATADVPCDGCTACCTSGQFVLVEPDETDVVAHLPAALLVAAPGLPAGNLLMAHDDRGRCPMLVDDRCSIYEHRPRTCRTYDCRVFAATGVAPPDDKPAIAERVAQWVFSETDPRSGPLRAALHDAAIDARAQRPDAPPARIALRAVSVVLGATDI